MTSTERVRLHRARKAQRGQRLATAEQIDQLHLAIHGLCGFVANIGSPVIAARAVAEAGSPILSVQAIHALAFWLLAFAEAYPDATRD
jgi:hypothetical protein